MKTEKLSSIAVLLIIILVHSTFHWDNNSPNILTKFLHSIFMVAYSANSESTKILRGPNTGNVPLWASHYTFLNASASFL